MRISLDIEEALIERIDFLNRNSLSVRPEWPFNTTSVNLTSASPAMRRKIRAYQIERYIYQNSPHRRRRSRSALIGEVIQCRMNTNFIAKAESR